MDIVEAFATKNRCYQAGAPLRPQGLMLHSIGTPQPSAAALARYFDQYQPGGQSVCVHGFIQRDGTYYQTLPYTMRAWHCGGAANATHIGVEMTEPGAGMTYAEAAEPAGRRRDHRPRGRAPARHGQQPRRPGISVECLWHGLHDGRVPKGCLCRDAQK